MFVRLCAVSNFSSDCNEISSVATRHRSCYIPIGAVLLKWTGDSDSITWMLSVTQTTHAWSARQVCTDLHEAMFVLYSSQSVMYELAKWVEQRPTTPKNNRLGHARADVSETPIGTTCEWKAGLFLSIQTVDCKAGNDNRSIQMYSYTRWNNKTVFQNHFDKRI